MSATLFDERTCIETDRLRLRCWQDGPADRDAIFKLLGNPQTMRDHGFTMDRAASERKFESYLASFRHHGYARWVVETHDGLFLGYVGVMGWYGTGHPMGDHEEIGWRFLPEAWGHGYATEAARVAIADGFNRVGLERIVAYTAPDNLSSQAVMARLEMQRDESLDFVVDDPDVGLWHGLVWLARKDPAIEVTYARVD